MNIVQDEKGSILITTRERGTTYVFNFLDMGGYIGNFKRSRFEEPRSVWKLARMQIITPDMDELRYTALYDTYGNITTVCISNNKAKRIKNFDIQEDLLYIGNKEYIYNPQKRRFEDMARKAYIPASEITHKKGLTDYDFVDEIISKAVESENKYLPVVIQRTKN